MNIMSVVQGVGRKRFAPPANALSFAVITSSGGDQLKKHLASVCHKGAASVMAALCLVLVKETVYNEDMDGRG